MSYRRESRSERNEKRQLGEFSAVIGDVTLMANTWPHPVIIDISGYCLLDLYRRLDAEVCRKVKPDMTFMLRFTEKGGGYRVRISVPGKNVR